MDNYSKLIEKETNKRIDKVKACKVDTVLDLKKRTDVYKTELKALGEALVSNANRYIKDNNLVGEDIDRINEINETFANKFTESLLT